MENNTRSKSDLTKELHLLRQQLADLKKAQEEYLQTEQALLESRQRLMKAEEVAHLGSWEMEFATGDSKWSDEFYRICGLEPGAVRASSEAGFKLIHPDDQERAAEAVQRALETGQRYDVEKRIVRPDGTVRYVQSIGQVLYDEEGRPLKLIGSFLDITDRKLAEEAMKRQAAQLVTLNQIGREMAGMVELPDLIAYTTFVLKQDLGYQNAFVVLVDEFREMAGVATLATAGKDHPIPLNFEVQVQPFKERQSIRVPIGVGRQYLGLICLEMPSETPLSESDKNMLSILAEQLAVAIKNVLLFEQVQTLATTDALTGTFNRRKLIELGEREINRTGQYGYPFSILLLDVDHFKSVNDLYRHEAGDKLLKQLAEVWKGELRDSDVLCRYGGDEFVVLLPRTTLDGAVEIGKRLRGITEKTRIEIKGEVVSVTASFGAAAFKPGMKELQVLIQAADEALYQAKREGGNEVVVG